MAVDSVSGVSSTTATKASTTDANKASLDYNSFLQLLIAQMKNQDPTDPMDASEQVSQLATFSQVEQAIKTNTHLENLISQTSMNSAASYIGKTITSADGSTSGVIASVKVTSDGVVATTTAGKKITIGEGVTIRDATLSALTEASALIGTTLTGTDGKALTDSSGNTLGAVAGVSVTDDGSYAMTTDGSIVELSQEITIQSTISATGYEGTRLLGKTLTSADGQTTGVVESVTVTDSGVFALTTSGGKIAIVNGVTIGDTTA